jgi:hypothetical protein
MVTCPPLPTGWSGSPSTLVDTGPNVIAPLLVVSLTLPPFPAPPSKEMVELLRPPVPPPITMPVVAASVTAPPLPAGPLATLLFRLKLLIAPLLMDPSAASKVMGPPSPPVSPAPLMVTELSSRPVLIPAWESMIIRPPFWLGEVVLTLIPPVKIFPLRRLSGRYWFDRKTSPFGWLMVMAPSIMMAAS